MKVIKGNDRLNYSSSSETIDKQQNSGTNELSIELYIESTDQ